MGLFSFECFWKYFEMETFSTETRKLLFVTAEWAHCKPLCNLVTDDLHMICFQYQAEKIDQAEEPCIQPYIF